jgi:hypothetical protein
MNLHPDSAADLIPIGKLLVFIGVPPVRNGMMLPTYPVDECADRLALVRFPKLLFMCEFPLAISGNTIRKPCHGD